MKILKEISEDEMIATFLKGELSSVRFGDGIVKILEQENIAKDIVENPDINNQDQNSLRRNIFKTHRGYGANAHLFENFPSDVVWKKAILSKEELANIKYINYDYWVELSNGTRFAKDGAKSVIAGKEVFRQSNERFLQATEAIKQGVLFTDLILVSPDIEGYLVVLEGHLRLTALCIAIDYIPEETEVIVGFSKEIYRWNLY